MLSVDVQLTQGRFQLACAFDSRERVTGVFGPSGAGKSTMLRILAGLARPDRGRVEIAGRCVFDAALGINVPAHDRRIGFVFQQAGLLPHLNVRHNLAYGAWFSRRAADPRRFSQVVDMLDIGALLKRRVNGLSGGEAQRVAIGRALLSNPDLLLLDEPLASLDDARKREVLPYIERLSQTGDLPIVFVSHQLDELLRLANRQVVAIRDGRIVFAGATADFLAQPALLGVSQARGAGVLLQATVAHHETDDGLTVLDCGGQPMFVPYLDQPPGMRISLHVRAREVIVARERPSETSALNVLEAFVVGVMAQDDHGVDIILDVGGQRLDARITRRSARLLALAPGQRVYALIKSLALAEQAWQRLGGL